MYIPKKMVFIVLITAVIASGITLAFAHGGDSDLIHSCVNNNSGTIKIVAPDEECANNEIPLDWNANGVGKTGSGGIFTAVLAANSNIQCGSFVGGSSGLCEPGHEVPIPSDGRLTTLALNIVSNTRPVDATYTLLVNGTPTDLQAQIPAFSSSDIIVTGNVTVQAGDLIVMRSNGGGVPTTDGTVDARITLEYLTD